MKFDFVPTSREELNADFNRAQEAMNKSKNDSITLRALEQAEQAINDTIALYCPEFSHKSTVKAAQKRMAEKGTLGYYADVLATIRAAKDRLNRVIETSKEA